jgi:hypothetical protein
LGFWKEASQRIYVCAKEEATLQKAQLLVVVYHQNLMI